VSPRWDLSTYRKTRDAHLRKAARALDLARDTAASKDARRIWREHARQHVKAARRENWLLVGHLRAVSASMFFRKTAGYGERATRHMVGGTARA